MTLSVRELDAVCHELEPLVVGVSVHKVVQPDADTILLSLRGRWLLISSSARTGRIHLVPERPAGTGEAATPFCMLLRKHLTHARVSSLRAVPGERACELEFTSADETAHLRLFLFGASSQLQLVGRGDDGQLRVLGAIGPAKKLHDGLPPPRDATDAKASRFSPPLSDAIDAHYATVEHGADVDDARRDARLRLDAQLKKHKRLVAALSADLVRADGAQARKKEGDLLLAHLHEIPRGAASVTLPDDFTDGSPIEIVLDPAYSARDNAQRLYKEHKRLHRARGTIERRLRETEAKVATLSAQRKALDDRSDEAVLADARALPPTPTPKEKQHAQRTQPYRRFESLTGVPIFVGRGAEKNDELTWKVARGNDLWLHTRDVPGAHVVVPMDKTTGGATRTIDAETLVDAATLAAHHSNARDEAQVDVGYALKKHLRKPRGGAPGQVLVSNQKTIRVRLEPSRLERLLKTRDA